MTSRMAHIMAKIDYSTCKHDRGNATRKNNLFFIVGKFLSFQVIVSKLLVRLA